MKCFIKIYIEFFWREVWNKTTIGHDAIISEVRNKAT